ncbi:MAG TPA: quinolinate synthase NadA [Candidatus Hydrogenedentes bacterium]|nr:quinolinate synthase NadA [Candidatus Hydrogenedentota bacterium]
MTSLATISSTGSLEEFTEALVARMKGVVPESETRLKAPIAWEILRVKEEVNAVILGHNYMEPVLYHSVPDYTGDSLQLSAIAAGTNADVIVFCGVWFMGETAKILNPDKIVLVPSTRAGCSLAEGVTAEDVLRLRERFPGTPVVSYVNTYATVKAVSDYCCTSGNADKVVKHLLDAGHREIIFVPDRYLAENTARQLGARFWMAGGEEEQPPVGDGPLVIGWRARCEVHELFTPEDVDNVRRQYPDAVILAHPECSPEVIAKVDIAGSTKLMVDYVRDSKTARRVALFTECAMGDNLAAEFPEKELVRSCSLRCKHMNTITLEDTLRSLRTLTPRVELDPDIIARARQPIDRMLAIR